MHHGPIPSLVALAVATAPLISESARLKNESEAKDVLLVFHPKIVQLRRNFRLVSDAMVDPDVM